MPPAVGKDIEEAFNKEKPGVTIGVMPRIYFAHRYLSELCKRAQLQRELKDFSSAKRYIYLAPTKIEQKDLD